MRSRFSAYALGLVDYIIATTHPDGPHQGRYGQRESVQAFCDATQFTALEVHGSSAEHDLGQVSFWATLSQGSTDASFGERSKFMRVDGRWLYHSGERIGRKVG